MKLHEPINQRKVISKLDDDIKNKMNPCLFKRSDDAIVDELKKIILSCERKNKYFLIKVKSFETVDDYTEINKILSANFDNSMRNKSKFKKRDNPYSCINLNESDIRLLLVHYHVEVFNKPAMQSNVFTGKPLPTEEDFTCIIAIPKIINKYYIRINGIMRSTLYQIVDGSTYNNSNTNSKIPNVSFKIVFMALRIFRYYLTIDDINGEEVKLTQYMVNCFRKTVTGCKYILAKLGFTGSMKFLNIHDVLVTMEPIKNENYYCFKRHDIFISVPKYLLNDKITQTFICSVYHSIIPGMTIYDIYDNKFWVRSLGADFNNTPAEKLLNIIRENDTTITDTLIKGTSILESFENIYDISTKESIRLPYNEKATMYHIIRWILREFDRLKSKNNLDLRNKKLRFPEYIANIYGTKIGSGIYRIADLGSKITTISIRKAIRTDPLFLVNSISKSNLVEYRNGVSDMDSPSALKFTYKGISGLGEGSDKRIPDIIRYIDPSHVGILDLDSSSDSNPGISGTISPFAKMYGCYFSDYEEPREWQEKYDTIYSNYNNLKEDNTIKPIVFDK